MESRLEPTLDISPAKEQLTAESTKKTLPLQAYSIIAKRNLFAGAGPSEETHSHEPEAKLEDIPPAQESLGLRLVGTVVRGESEQNLAIIQNRKARKQKIVYVGDELSEALIKRVLRQKVILTTERGDELLTMEFRSKPRTRGKSRFVKPQRSPFGRKTRGRISLDREEVGSFLQNMAQGKRQVRMRPYFNERRHAGIRLNNIKPGSLYAKMGLRNGDVIKTVNGMPLTRTKRIAELYRHLEQGGEVDLDIKRRGRNRKLQLFIR
jgi:general secretion pathway protein C